MHVHSELFSYAIEKVKSSFELHFGKQGDFKFRTSTRKIHFNICICVSTDYGQSIETLIKDIGKFGPMWQTKYASDVHKNLGLGLDFRPCSEDHFLTGCP